MALFAQKSRGQVIPLLTLSLMLMFGILGLVVDLGWSYFVEKTTQTASDTAALAAVRQAYVAAGPSAPYLCGVNLVCASVPVPCPASGNLSNGCLYAASNGFTHNGESGRQFVTMAAGTTSPPPTAPGADVLYWVTARAGQRIPQLFSSVQGNMLGLAASRSTAAIADIVAPGSLYGLNQVNDPGPFGTGVDLTMIGGQGQNWIRTTGSVYLASTARGPGTWAAETSGTAFVEASATYIYGTGMAKEPGTYRPPPTNLSDPLFFEDLIEHTTRQVGQPSAPSAADAPLFPINGGTIAGDCSNPPTYASGTYYATNSNGAPTGDPIRVTGCVNFGTAGQFNHFVFVGGFHLPSAQTRVTVSPGRYFVAGARNNTLSFYMHTGAYMTDQTPLGSDGRAVPNTDLGEIFVFTDTRYPGLEWLPQSIKSLPLRYGQVEVQMGNNDGSELNLHGLNADPAMKALLPGNLQHFTPIVFYVDQGNSRIDYDDGAFVTSCGSSPCLNSDPTVTQDPMMHLQASPNLDLYGTVYVPRGASLSFQGGGNLDSPMQVIAGTIRLRGGAQVNFTPMIRGFSQRRVVLVE